MQKIYLSFLTVFSLLFFNAAHAQIRITEYQYNGSEFVELTNTGTSPVDMTGWSFDDNSRTAGSFSLSAFGNVRAGESVIISETTAAAFRTLWNLCDNIKVIGSNTQNLGRADEINIYDNNNALIDRLTYDDQTLGGPRTDVKSAWVTAAAMGNNTVSNWVHSNVADAEASYTATSGGFVASPGKSARAAVAYNPCAPGQMRITEYQYNGSEFVELTNVGGLPVNMNGWSFDDNSRAAGSFSLSDFGSVQGGESVIVAEATAAAFRTLWNLCDGIKVIGSNSQNLGRADEINIYDNNSTLIDRLTYDDQTLGGPRTDTKSAWVPFAAMGNNTVSSWIHSNVADAEASYTATSGGFVASPGTSARATVTFNPCSSPAAGAPTIVIDVATTSNFIDRGVTTAPASPFAVSAVINDATDILKTSGIHFIISDDITPVDNLTVTATSSLQSVVSNANLVWSGTGANRTLTITPSATGYSNITVTVTDGESLSKSFVLNYAASATASSAYYWPTGIADASAAIPLGENQMLIANDETNILYVYDRRQSGLPVKTIDINAGNILNLTDGSTGAWKEVDIEAAAASRNIANRIYWIGSLGNGSDGDLKPNRNRIFATQVTGSGDATNITTAGSYANLRAALITWGNSHGYNFTASAQAGHEPKNIDGFNVEGMVFGPDGTTMYIGFRAPLVPTGNRTKALIAPIQNFEVWFNNGAPAGNPVIGDPIELALGTRGIRDIIRLNNGTYVIAAGSYNDNSIPAIFRWSGQAADQPLLIPSFNVAGLNVEALLPVIESGTEAFDKIQVICDNGDNIFYNDGIVAKDLPNDSQKKFASFIAQSNEGSVLPVKFISFNGYRSGTAVQLAWTYTTTAAVTQFDVQRSADGLHFYSIATLSSGNKEYIDASAGNGRIYYRIVARDITGASFESLVKTIQATGNTAVHIYPNPVVNDVFISADVAGIKTVRVMNGTGSVISTIRFSGNLQKIDTRSWAKGIYFISLLNSKGEKITQEKILVQ